MEELEFLKLLKDKKVADAYQYYKACLYKLYLAEISFEALTNVITEYQQREKVIVEKVYEDAITKGKRLLMQYLLLAESNSNHTEVVWDC